MKLRKPNYYDRFRCIDWEEGHFLLEGKEERCPFLNKAHLCDLILELSEDALCDICREHPRFYDWFEGVTEVGLGLCCEEAARLLLEEKGPFCLVEEEIADSEESDLDEFGSKEEREEEMQDCLDFGDSKGILAVAEQFAGEEVWLAQQQLEEVTREREYEYEQLASYFVYRYFMKCREDGSIRSKSGLVLVGVLLIHLMDLECVSQTGQLTTKDRAGNARICSKELEYSEENLELVEEAF